MDWICDLLVSRKFLGIRLTSQYVISEHLLLSRRQEPRPGLDSVPPNLHVNMEMQTWITSKKSMHLNLP